MSYLNMIGKAVALAIGSTTAGYFYDKGVALASKDAAKPATVKPKAAAKPRVAKKASK